MTPFLTLICVACGKEFQQGVATELCPECTALAQPPDIIRFFTLKTPNGLKIIDRKIKANLEAMNRKERRRWLARNASKLPKADTAKLASLAVQGAILRMPETAGGE